MGWSSKQEAVRAEFKLGSLQHTEGLLTEPVRSVRDTGSGEDLQDLILRHSNRSGVSTSVGQLVVQQKERVNRGPQVGAFSGRSGESVSQESRGTF